MSAPTDAELREIIRREARFRALIVLLLPAGAALMWWAVDRQEIFWAGLVIATIELCLLGLQRLWLRWGHYLVVIDYFSMAMDVIAITLGLHFLGGAEFPFDWVYAVSLASISILRGLGPGLLFAQWSTLCYGALLWTEYRGILPHMVLFPLFAQTPLYNNPQYVLTKLLSNAAIFNLAALNAAFFSSVLKQKVEQRTQELKQAQVQLMHSQKLANLGQLAASLAHSLANPITGIRGSAELLADELSADAPAQRRVSQILHWSDHLASLLERLRNFARPPEEDRKLVDVNRCVRDVLDLTSKLLMESKIQVQEAFDPGLPLIRGSSHQLEELFMNLVLNARDAMPQGGRLTTSTVRQDGSVVVAIKDTGVGMSPETQKHIFEAFFTTKGEGGTGLGLNISRQIVLDHGGRLSVESEEGQGTTFTIELPVAE